MSHRHSSEVSSSNFSLPEQEPEAKPQAFTEDFEKKKYKKPKKISSTQAITGFEEAFEQFATSSMQNSKKSTVGSPLSPRESDIPADSKLDVNASQVRFSSWMLIVTSYCVQHAFIVRSLPQFDACFTMPTAKQQFTKLLFNI